VSEYGPDPRPTQTILNAGPVPPRHAQEDHPELPVMARLVWETDGVEFVETVAYASYRSLVLVRVDDGRALLRGYWLDVSDVRRR
jgi:hypothetical protein